MIPLPKKKVSGADRTSLDALESDKRIAYLREYLERDGDENRTSKIDTLHDAIFDLIERGFWRTGDKIPGEKELSILLGLSLGTVQATLRQLVAEKLLERRRGAGTFIAQSSDSSSSIWHFRFRAPHNGGGLLPWTSNVFDVQEIDEAGEWADFLGFAPGYIRIKRKINFEDFTVYSEMYLDGPRFAPILDVPKELLSQKNIRVFLHDRYNAPTFRAHHRVTSIQLDEQSAKIVGAAAGSPGLRMRIFGYSFRDAPILFQKNIIPQVPYELEIL